MRGTSLRNGPAATRLLIGAAALLTQLCVANSESPGQQPTPPSNTRAPIRSRAKALSNVQVPTGAARPSHELQTYQPPPQQPPPQNPPPRLILSPSSQQVRVGEIVTFTAGSSVTLDLPRPMMFSINYGDDTPEETVELYGPPVPHRFTQPRTYKVRVYSGDLIARRFPAAAAETTIVVSPWSITPTATQIDLGKPITVNIDNPSNDKAIRYLFHFANDQEPSEPSATPYKSYVYHSPGTFQVSADISVVDGLTSFLWTTRSLDIVVKELAVTALRLKAEPLPVEVGKDVSFTATFDSPFGANDSNIAFNFLFGDGKSTDWQPGRTATHSYAAPNDNYQAQVKVGWRNAQTGQYSDIASSEPHPIQVLALQSPPPVTNSSNRPQGEDQRDGPDRPPYVVYFLTALVVIAIALLFASYKTWNAHYAAKPEYTAHADRGSAQANDGRVNVEFELRMNQNSGGSLFQIDPSPAGLIRFERITHD